MEYKDWLITSKPSLSKSTVNIPDLLMHLESAGLLGETKTAEIYSKHGATMQAKAMYDHLGKYGVEAVEKIINCLEKSGNAHVVTEFKQWKNNSASISSISDSSVWFEVGQLVYNFTGRDLELKKLRGLLLAEQSSECIISSWVCIAGLGGIGKSTLARKYAFKYQASYDGNVIWIQAETLDSMRASFIRLTKYLGLGVSDMAPNKEIAAAIYQNFRTKKCLFIFDNVEEKKYLDQFQPADLSPNYSCPDILITSRVIGLIPKEENQLNLEVLTESEAIKLVQTKLPKSSTAAASSLAGMLQRFPLALQQAIAYIGETYINSDHDQCISRYLRDFESYRQRLLSDDKFQKHNDYSETTFTTWQVSLKGIKKKEGGKSAIKVINLLAYLNPDNISVEFVGKVLHLYEMQSENGVISRLSKLFRRPRRATNIEQSLTLLKQFSMINLNSTMVGVHRLVQQVIRLSLASKEVNILEVIIKLLEVDMDTWTTWKTMFADFRKECFSHGLHLFQFQRRHNELMEGREFYLSNLCYFVLEYGNYTDGLSIAEQLSSIYESMNGNEHPSTILLKQRQADAQYWLHNYSESIKILQSILPSSEFDFSDLDIMLTSNTLLTLARNYSKMGKHQQAVDICDVIISVLASVVGEENPDVLNFKNNKAVALERLGKLDEAWELFQYLHEKHVEIYGEDHVRTLWSRNGMADVTFKKGKLIEALDMYKEVYEAHKRMLGETHPYTMYAKNQIEKIQSSVSTGDED